MSAEEVNRIQLHANQSDRLDEELARSKEEVHAARIFVLSREALIDKLSGQLASTHMSNVDALREASGYAEQVYAEFNDWGGNLMNECDQFRLVQNPVHGRQAFGPVERLA